MSNRNYTYSERTAIDIVKSNKCYYCNKELKENDKITIDHKTPVSRGGSTKVENLVIACEKCNSEKADMTEQEYYLYKKKQKELQENFEVKKVINDLIKTYSEIEIKSKYVDHEYNKICKEIHRTQEEMLEDNFNASEGYSFAKKLKDLYNKKNELYLLSSEYRLLYDFVKIQKQGAKQISENISIDLYEKNKALAKKKVFKKVDIIAKVSTF